MNFHPAWRTGHCLTSERAVETSESLPLRAFLTDIRLPSLWRNSFEWYTFSWGCKLLRNLHVRQHWVSEWNHRYRRFSVALLNEREERRVFSLSAWEETRSIYLVESCKRWQDATISVDWWWDFVQKQDYLRYILRRHCHGCETISRRVRYDDELCRFRMFDEHWSNHPDRIVRHSMDSWNHRWSLEVVSHEIVHWPVWTFRSKISHTIHGALQRELVHHCPWSVAMDEVRSPG